MMDKFYLVKKLEANKEFQSFRPDGKGEPSNYLIPKGKHINFNQGEKIKKGEYLY